MLDDGTITQADLFKAVGKAFDSDSNDVREWLHFVKVELRDHPNHLKCFGHGSEFGLECSGKCDYYADCADFCPFLLLVESLEWDTIILEEAD